MTDSPIVTVLTASDPAEARLVAAYLRGHDITVFVQDEAVASILPEITSAIGGLRIQVPGDQAEDATALLEDFEQGSFDYSDTGFSAADFEVPEPETSPSGDEGSGGGWIGWAISVVVVSGILLWLTRGGGLQ